MKNILHILFILLLIFSTNALQAQEFILDSGMGGSNWVNNGCGGGPENSNSEVPYGGANSSNIVAEIDNQACQKQVVCIIPGKSYNFNLKISRRTSGGCLLPAGAGMRLIIKGVQSGTTYFNNVYTPTNTTFSLTPISTLLVAASATDKQLSIEFSQVNNSTTCGVIIDDASLIPVNSIAISPNSACQNDAASVSISGMPASGVTYSWNSGSGGSPATSTATSPTFTWSTAGTKTITAAINNGTCTKTFTSSFTVNGTPSVTVTNPSICSGVAFSSTPTSTIAGTTYTWSSSILTAPTGGTITGFSNQLTSVSAPISQTLTNTGTSNGIVRYVLTPSGPGACVGSNVNLDVTVKPSVIGSASSSTICTGTPQNTILNANIAGTTFTATAALISGTATGFSNITTAIAGPITQTLNNTGTTTAIVRYTVTPIKDGCNGTPFIYNVSVNPKPTASGTNATICSSDNFSVTPTSNIVGTTYSWTTSIVTTPSGGTVTGQTNQVSAVSSPISQTLINTGTSNGIVRYTVTPYNGTCAGNTFTFDITVRPQITVTTLYSVIACDGGTTTMSATAVTGTGGFTYSLNGGAYQNNASFQNKIAGIYTITVKGAGNCTGSAIVNVLQPNPISITPSVTQANCNGGTASLSIATTGGTGTKTYKLNAGSFQSSNSYSGLAIGNYTVIVKDANNCTNSTTFTISQPSLLVATISSSTSISCNGGNNGSASINASGGSSPYAYQWSPTGGSSSTASTLIAGTYTCQVTDANGCIKTSSVTLTQPIAMATSISSQTNVNCNGSSTGAATISVANGTSPYTYSWSPTGGSAITATNLLAGTYSCTVTDNNSCQKTQVVTITQPTSLVVSMGSTTIICPTDSSTLTVNAAGGTTPYSYKLNAGSYQSSNILKVIAGTYTITVKDANNCTISTTITKAITDITAPTIACPSSITTNTDAGLCQKTITGINLIATDNCIVSKVTWSIAGATNLNSALTGINNASGNVFQKGTSTVTYIATDNSNNSSTCNFSITVNDNQAPSISCPTNKIAAANASCEKTVSGISPMSFSDNCAGVTVSYSITGATSATGNNDASNTVFAKGVSNVVYTITDASSNTTTCSFLVTVNDSTKPVLTCLPTQTLSLNVACTVTLPNYLNSISVTDNCTATNLITLQQIPSAGTILSGAGTLPVKIIATDAAGNKDSCTFNVIKDNLNPPAVNCMSAQNLQLSVNCSAVLPDYTSLLTYGNVCGMSGVSITQSPAPGTIVYGVGDLTVTFTAFDANNSTSSNCSAIIHKIDITAPIIVCPAPTSLYLNSACSASLPDFTNSTTATDGCSISSLITFTQTPIATTVLNGVGSVNVIMTAFDASGNSASCNFQVAHIDTIKPTVTCPSATIANADQGVCTATIASLGLPVTGDNCGVFTLVNNHPSSTFASGNTTVIWTVTDVNGNASSCMQQVTVADNQAPVISNCATSLQSYTTSNCTALVPDFTNSVIASDNCTASNALSITQSPLAGTAVGVGVTSITITVTDASNLSSTCNTTFTVLDTTATVTHAGSTQNLNCNTPSAQLGVAAHAGFVYSWSPVTGLNNAGIAMPIASPTASTIYTITVTSASGCSATSTVVVNINNAMPIANAGGTQTINCTNTSATIGTAAIGGDTYLWMPNTNLSSNTIAQPTASPNSTTIYTVTVSAANGCSNTSTVEIIVDNTLPVANAGASQSLNCTNPSTSIGTSSIIGNTYSWLPNTNLSNNTIAQPTANPSTSTIYTVTVLGSNGCTNTSTVLLTVDKNLPIADAGNDLNLDCITTSGIIGTSSIVGNTYSWSPSTGLSNASIAQPIASPVASTNYTVTVSSANGCSATDVVTVYSSNVVSLMNPSLLAYPNNNFCFGTNIQLKAIGDPSATFNWIAPVGCVFTTNNSISGESTISIQNLDASCNGYFKVNQVLAGCATSYYDSILVDGGQKAYVNFVNTACVSNNGQVTVNATGIATLEYSINGGVYQSSNVLTVNPGANFIVAVRPQNTSCETIYAGQCVYCAPAGACANPPKDSLVIPNVVCEGVPIPIQNYFTNATIANFTTSGSGMFNTSNCNTSPCTIYYTPSIADMNNGSVIITATTNDPDGVGPCVASVTSKYIILANGLVAPTITTNSPVCENSLLTFSTSNSIGSISWQGQNGYTANGNTVIVNNAPASMSGNLIATSSAYGCNNVSASEILTIISAPTLSVSVIGNPELCAGGGNGSIQVAVAGGSGNYTICYNGNLANCVNGTSANFQWIAPGTYTVTVIDQACPNNTFSYPVIVLPGTVVPSPTVAASITACAGDNVSLIGTTSLSNSTINWTNATNNFNALGNPLMLYSANANLTGIYYAKTIDSNGCASQSVPVQLTINEKPIINHVQINCNGLSSIITITASVVAGSIEYSLNGNTYQSSNEFLNTPAGNYTLFVRKIGSSCVTSLPLSAPNCACPNGPDVHIVTPLVSCGLTPIPMTATFVNTPSASWSTAGTGSFSTISGASPLSTFYTPSSTDLALGYINLTLTTADPDGAGPCTAVTENVLIYLKNTLQAPIITTNKSLYCAGDSVILTATNINSLVEWHGVGGFYSDSTIAFLPSVTQFLSGKYVATAAGNGCATMADSVMISIVAPPSLSMLATPVAEGCAGHGNGEITVDVSGGSGKYTICSMYAANCVYGVSPVTFKWLAPDTYTIYIADSSCSNYWNTITATVNPGTVVAPPTAASYNSPVCEGEDLILNANGPIGSTYMWTDLKNGFTATGEIVTRENASVEMSGKYKLQRVENGCASEDVYLDVRVYDYPQALTIDTMCAGGDSGIITINTMLSTTDTFEFALNNGAFQLSNVFNLLSNGLYEVKARSVGSYCEQILGQTELYCACHCGKDAQVNVFPNPNNGSFSVNASLVPENAGVVVSVFDISGKTIYEQPIEVKFGQFTHSIDIKAYAVGSYMVRVLIDGEKFLVPIIVNGK